ERATIEEKSETRNPKSETNSKLEEENEARQFRVFLFGIRICFGFRHSDFGFPRRGYELENPPRGVAEVHPGADVGPGRRGAARRSVGADRRGYGAQRGELDCAREP